jgi:hypothetical protein
MEGRRSRDALATKELEAAIHALLAARAASQIETHHNAWAARSLRRISRAVPRLRRGSARARLGASSRTPAGADHA